MKNLSEILRELDETYNEFKRLSSEMEEGEEKDEILTHLGVVIDCLDCDLLYGNYINDTGKEFDYYNY